MVRQQCEHRNIHLEGFVLTCGDATRMSQAGWSGRSIW
jgi:hypothetical protein